MRPRKNILTLTISLLVIFGFTFVFLLMLATANLSSKEKGIGEEVDVALESPMVAEKEPLLISEEESPEEIKKPVEQPEIEEMVELRESPPPPPVKVEKPRKGIKPSVQNAKARPEIKGIKLIPSAETEVGVEVAVAKGKPSLSADEKLEIEKNIEDLEQERIKAELAKKRIEEEKAEMERKVLSLEQQGAESKEEAKKIKEEKDLVLSKAQKAQERITLLEQKTLELQEKALALQEKALALEAEKKRLNEEQRLTEEAKRKAEEGNILAEAERRRLEEERKKLKEEKDLFMERAMRVEERVSNIITAQKLEAEYVLAEAKKAIAKAKAVDAGQYTPEELKEAEDSLEIAEASWRVRDYTKCLISATRTKEKAEQAETGAKGKVQSYKSNLLVESLRLLSLWGQ